MEVQVLNKITVYKLISSIRAVKSANQLAKKKAMEVGSWFSNHILISSI